jgi:hypothetical protein
MIGLPLRLLAREIYDRIVAQKGRGCVALITGEEKIVPPRPQYFVCTVEAMPLNREVEFLAVDEIQLCADPERGHVFTHRLLHARGRSETMLLGAGTMAPLIRRLLPHAEIVSRENGMRVASFPGGKHVTFNMPLWRRDFAETATRADMDTLLKGMQASSEKIDVLALLQQPQSWRGIANPLALLPHQASANECPVLNMTPDTAPTDRVSSSMRKRLKTKEAKYKGLPGYSYQHATTPAEVKRVLDLIRAGCRNRDEPAWEVCRVFNTATRDGADNGRQLPG